MKKFNKIVTVIVAFAMIVSSLTMLAIHDEHVHVHAAETVPAGKTWSLHDKNANDEYIAFTANNTSPFSFADVHLWYTMDGANVTGANEKYDGRTFGSVGLSQIDGDTVQIGAASSYEVNKAAVYQKDANSFIAAVKEARTGNDNTNIAAGEIWGIVNNVNTVAVVFTAPVTGSYTLTETIRRWWGPYAGVNNDYTAPSRVVIESADGKVVKDLKGNTSESVTTTINLVAGEKVKLFVDNCGNGASDNYEIEALTAKYNGAPVLTAGASWTFQTCMNLPGTNVNGKFAMGAIVRDNPTTGAEESEHEAIWAAFNRWGAAPYASYKAMWPYDGSQYVANGKEGTANTIYKIPVNGAGAFNGNITAEVIKIVSFTAPADGEYTFSFDCVSYWGCAFFSSVGENDLIMRARIDGNGSAVKSHSETVTLKAGEVYNAGFTRATGDYTDANTPFTDQVGMTVTNAKMTYNDPIDTYSFLDPHFGGDSYKDGTGVFTVGSRPIDRSAEDVTGIGNAFTPAELLVQDYSRHNDTLKYLDGNYSLPVKTAYVNQSWTNGTSGQIINNGVYMGTLNGETDSFKVHVSPSDDREVVIAFKAPTCGTFSFELQAHEFYGDATRASLYYVEANGEIVEGCTKTTPGNKDVFTFTGTVTLKGGEYIYFAFNGAADGSGANHNYIDKLTVTVDEETHTGTAEWVSNLNEHYKAYTCCGKATTAAEAHNYGTDLVCDDCAYTPCNVTFDFAENFENPENGSFTVGMVHRVHGVFVTENTYYDGSDETVTNAATGGTLVGYKMVANGEYRSYITKVGSEIIFFPQAADFSSAFVFVAPVDGTYAYDFEAQSKWNVSHTRFGFYVTLGDKANGEIVKLHADVFGEEGINNADSSTHVAAADTLVNYEGTIALKAGQKIYFGVDPVDGTAGDNALLKKLQVTLTHEGGEASCKDKAVCENCGASYGELNPNNHASASLGYTDNGDGTHDQVRACCGEVVIDNESHSYGDDDKCDKCSNTCGHAGGTATCKTQATCTICGQKYGELDASNHEDKNGTWTSDKTGHSFNRTCCDTSDIAKTAHNFVNGKCTACQYQCVNTYTLDASQFGTATNINGFSFKFATGSHGDFFNRITDTVLEGGKYKTAAGGTDVFFTTNGQMTGRATGGSIVPLIVFTAPVSGTYTLVANAHGWGGTQASELAAHCGSWKNGVILPANNAPQTSTNTVTLEAGQSFYYVIREIDSSNGAGFTINSITVTMGAHEGGTATCTDKAVCTVCGLSYGSVDASNHTNTTEFNYTPVDANGHKVTYKCCNAVKTESEGHNNGNDNVCDDCGYGCNHSGGTATCKTQAVCDTCGASYGELDPRNHEDAEGTWTKTQDGHSFNRTCCDTSDIALTDHTYDDGVCTVCDYECVHNGGEATCENKAVCDDCGEEYGDLAAHTGGTATCKTKKECDVCGELYGELDPDNHELNTFEYEDLGDGHKVTNECCGATVTASEDHDYIDGVCDLCGHACTHTGGNATCTDKAVCDDCGEEYGDTLDHDYVDGFCTVCGDEDPNYVPPVNPDTGDNFLAYALLIAGLGLLGVAFIPSKKRR